MKFARGQYINTDRQTCVLGALALSQGMSERAVRASVTGIDRVFPLLKKKLGLTDKTLETLMKLNDESRWKRLEDRLRKLEIFHLVRKYALHQKTKVLTGTKNTVKV